MGGNPGHNTRYRLNGELEIVGDILAASVMFVLLIPAQPLQMKSPAISLKAVCGSLGAP